MSFLDAIRPRHLGGASERFRRGNAVHANDDGSRTERAACGCAWRYAPRGDGTWTCEPMGGCHSRPSTDRAMAVVPNAPAANQ